MSGDSDYELIDRIRGEAEHAAYLRGVEDERHAARELLAAVLAYDEAIRECANDPDTMASYCTVQGASLDALYERMVGVANAMERETARALKDEGPGALQTAGASESCAGVARGSRGTPS